MAKTYYGYVKRDVADQTDWSAITKSMNDMLTTEAKRREDKKADIDKASREFGKVLSDSEGSSYMSLNEFWLDGANSIQEARRMQDTLLKSGRLNYKDYIAQRQNLTDGSNELIGLVKGFNSKWDAVKNDPNASAFDYANLANVQGFGNFTDYRAWTNPTDGRISLGKRVLNGVTGQYELSKDPNDFKEVNSLKNRMSQRAPKFDYEKATDEISKRLGRYVKVELKGAVATIENVKKLPGYEKMLDQYLDAIVIDDFNAASITTDGFGVYDYTYDKAEADKDAGKIYIGTNEMQPGSGLTNPKLTDTQRTKAKELLKINLESKLDYIETPAPKFKPDPKDNSIQKNTQAVTALAEIQSGDTLDKRKIAASNVAANSNIIKIVETPTEILVTRQSSTKDSQPVITAYQRGETTLDFIKGAASGMTGVEDLNAAIKNSSLTSDMFAAPIVKEEVLFERTTPSKPPGPLEKFDKQLNSDFKPGIITDEEFTEEKVIGKLTPLATKYGVTMEEAIGGRNAVKFKIGTGTNVVEQTIKFNDTDADGLLEALKGFIKSNKSATERFLSLESEKTGVNYGEK